MRVTYPSLRSYSSNVDMISLALGLGLGKHRLVGHSVVQIVLGLGQKTLKFFLRQVVSCVKGEQTDRFCCVILQV